MSEKIYVYGYDDISMNVVNTITGDIVGIYDSDHTISEDEKISIIRKIFMDTSKNTNNDNVTIRVSNNMPDILKESIAKLSCVMNYKYEDCPIDYKELIIPQQQNIEFVYLIIDEYNYNDDSQLICNVSVICRKFYIEFINCTIKDIIDEVYQMFKYVASNHITVSLCIKLNYTNTHSLYPISMNDFINLWTQVYDDYMICKPYGLNYKWNIFTEPNKKITKERE